MESKYINSFSELTTSFVDTINKTVNGNLILNTEILLCSELNPRNPFIACNHHLTRIPVKDIIIARERERERDLYN